MADLTITRRLKKEPGENPREYGQPTPNAIIKPIRFPDVNAEEYENGAKLIIKLLKMALK
jgi:hypothetical protein